MAAFDLLVEITLTNETLRYSFYGSSTSDGYYEGLLVSLNGLTRELVVNGGVSPTQDCRLVLKDSNGFLRTKNANETFKRKAIVVKLLDIEDGTVTTLFTGKIKDRNSSYDEFGIDARDDSYDILTEALPIRTTPDLFPDIPTTTPVELVPFALGTIDSTVYDSRGALPAYLVDPAVVAAGYRYIANQIPLKSVTAVYKNGSLVDSGDYTVSYANLTTSWGTFRVTYIDFDYDPRDVDGTDVQVTYDATGITDDLLETGTLVTNPATALQEFLESRGVLVSGDFDSTLVTAAATAYSSESLTIRAGFTGEGTWLDAINEYCRSLNLQFFKTRAGKFGMIFDDAQAPASTAGLKTFKDSVNILKGSFSPSMGKLGQDASSLDFAYGTDFARGVYLSRKIYNDSTEQTALGRDVIRTTELPFVSDINQGQKIAQIKLFQNRSDRIVINFDTIPEPDLELGDFILVTHYAGETTTNEGYKDKVFRVIGIEYRTQGDEIVCSLTAIDYPGLSIGSPADVEPTRDTTPPPPPQDSITANAAWTLTSYRAFSWAAFTLNIWRDGVATAYSIGSGSSGDLASGLWYIYFAPDTSLTVLQLTQTYANAVGPKKYLIATARTATVTTWFINFDPKVGTVTWSGGVPNTNPIGGDNIPTGTIIADHIKAGTITTTQLSATAIDGMTITGSTIQTASSGARIVLTSSALTTYDASSNALVTLPTSGGNTGHIVLTQSDSTPGQIIFGSVAYMLANSSTNNVLFNPLSDGVGNLYLGLYTSLRWNTIEVGASNTATFRARDDATHVSSLTLDNNASTSQIITLESFNTSSYVSKCVLYASSSSQYAEFTINSTAIATINSSGLTVVGTLDADTVTTNVLDDSGAGVVRIAAPFNSTSTLGGYSNAIEFQCAGTTRGYMGEGASDLYGFELGVGSKRGFVWVRNYSSAGPGVFALDDKNGTTYYLWVDTGGNLRGGTTLPTTTDTGGQVIHDLVP